MQQFNESPVSNLAWNITNFENHVRTGTYTHFENGQAPSFIMRFTNTVAGSLCCGVESLIDPNQLGAPDQEESYVDYLFYTHAYLGNCDELFDIINVPYLSGLKLENSHVSLYSIPVGYYSVNC